MTTNFNSKETYLAARTECKANQARLTLEARAARVTFNEAARGFSKVGLFHWPSTPAKDYTEAYKIMAEARSRRAAIRCDANDALEELKAMKVEATSQWAEARVARQWAVRVTATV